MKTSYISFFLLHKTGSYHNYRQSCQAMAQDQMAKRIHTVTIKNQTIFLRRTSQVSFEVDTNMDSKKTTKTSNDKIGKSCFLLI